MINANSFRFFLAAAIWVTLASGCTVAPASGAPSDAREVTVRFGDLDLSNVQGATATALYRRIRWAAEQADDAHDRTPLAIAPATAHRMRRLEGL
jgi:UrcA family protein